jgi:exosome complex RNA-binding protein Rrp4
MSTAPVVLLPGQPVPAPPKGPTPKYGAGLYERDGVVRASLVGSLENDQGVRIFLIPFCGAFTSACMPVQCKRKHTDGKAE